MRLFITVITAIFVCLPSAAFADAFEQYLTLSFPASEGFDRPNIVLGTITTIGRGRVESTTNDTVTIAHVFYDNHHRRSVRSRYTGLSSVAVKPAEIVARGQLIGRAPPTRATVEILDWTEHLADFVAQRKDLFVPNEEPVLVLVEHATHRMARYKKGVRTDLIEVGFGQAKGTKREEGDLKTPKGMYFVVDKYNGEFSGPTGPYFGGHWIKLNYPNAFDAERGVASRWISKEDASKIAKSWRDRELTKQKTRLGGGIGFHGWAGPWRLEDGGGLSWGCIVLHNPDIERLFDKIPKGTMVVIF